MKKSKNEKCIFEPQKDLFIQNFFPLCCPVHKEVQKCEPSSHSFFHKFCMKKSFWGPKMHFSFIDFYHKISYGENDFVIQII